LPRYFHHSWLLEVELIQWEQYNKSPQDRRPTAQPYPINIFFEEEINY